MYKKLKKKIENIEKLDDKEFGIQDKSKVVKLNVEKKSIETSPVPTVAPAVTLVTVLNVVVPITNSFPLAPMISAEITFPSISVPLTVNVVVPTSDEEVNRLVEEQSHNGMLNIIKYSKERLVSVDFNHTTQSCIFASDQTRVVENTCVRVLAWYDNEWSFSCRLVDTSHQLLKIGVN